MTHGDNNKLCGQDSLGSVGAVFCVLVRALSGSLIGTFFLHCHIFEVALIKDNSSRRQKYLLNCFVSRICLNITWHGLPELMCPKYMKRKTNRVNKK